MSNERITEDIVIDHFKGDPLFSTIKFEEQKSFSKRVIELLQSASKSGKGIGKPEFILSFPSGNMDYLIVVDATLMRGFNCYVGFKDDGIAIVNEREGMDIPRPTGRQKLYVVPGNKISTEIMGRALLGNVVLLGAYAAATGQLSLDELSKAVAEQFITMLLTAG